LDGSDSIPRKGLKFVSVPSNPESTWESPRRRKAEGECWPLTSV